MPQQAGVIPYIKDVDTSSMPRPLQYSTQHCMPCCSTVAVQVCILDTTGMGPRPHSTPPYTTLHTCSHMPGASWDTHTESPLEHKQLRRLERPSTTQYQPHISEQSQCPCITVNPYSICWAKQLHQSPCQTCQPCKHHTAAHSDCRSREMEWGNIIQAEGKLSSPGVVDT